MFRLLFIGFVAIALSGCGNLSPRGNLSPQLQNQFDATNGKISNLQNDQNALKFELMRLTQELGIQNSELRDLQQGMVNIQAGINNNEGVQVFQGGGPMVFAFAVITIGMLLYYFYKSKMHEKTAKILAQQINLYNNKDLENRVLAAAMNTEVEKDIYKLVRRK